MLKFHYFLFLLDFNLNTCMNQLFLIKFSRKSATKIGTSNTSGNFELTSLSFSIFFLGNDNICMHGACKMYIHTFSMTYGHLHHTAHIGVYLLILENDCFETY